MHVFRFVCIAPVALLLATGCVHISHGSAPPPPPSALDEDDDPDKEPRGKAVVKALCAVPPKGDSPEIIEIPVDEKGKVPSSYDVVQVGYNDTIRWTLVDIPGKSEELDIVPWPSNPPRFAIIKDSKKKPREVTAKRTGAKKKQCEAHSYDIKVWIEGEPVVGDPILIIRD